MTSTVSLLSSFLVKLEGSAFFLTASSRTNRKVLALLLVLFLSISSTSVFAERYECKGTEAILWNNGTFSPDKPTTKYPSKNMELQFDNESGIIGVMSAPPDGTYYPEHMKILRPGPNQNFDLQAITEYAVIGRKQTEIPKISVLKIRAWNSQEPTFLYYTGAIDGMITGKCRVMAPCEAFMAVPDHSPACEQHQ